MTSTGETEIEPWAVRFHEFYAPGSRAEKEFRLSRKLVLVARRWTAFIDETVKRETGYSRAQWQTLLTLVISDGDVATLELAERLAVSWPSLIRVLDHLEEKGLVARKRDPKDRRSTIVGVTAEGREVMARIQGILDPLRARTLQGLSDDDLLYAKGLLDRLFDQLVQEAGPD